MIVQTRSEKSGIIYFNTLKEALSHAIANSDVWKISFTVDSGESVRLVRYTNTDSFVYQPISLGDYNA